MSSTSNTTPSNAAAVPRYSTTAPPPYTSSDIQSVASKNSTSKSVLEKMFKRSSEAAPSGSNDVQKRVEENEAKLAARASYFFTR